MVRKVYYIIERYRGPQHKNIIYFKYYSGGVLEHPGYVIKG